MSEQAQGVERALREAGITPPAVPPRPGEPPPGDQSGGVRPPNVVLLELPRDGRGLDEFAREAGAIAKTNGVYRRDRVPVTIDKEAMAVAPMTTDRFRTYLSKLAFVHKVRKQQTEAGETLFVKKKATMNKETASGTLASDDFLDQQRRLAKINVVRQPIMRADGRVELLPEGYDAASEIFTIPGGPAIDESWDLARARTFLLDLHKEFPFAGKDEEGVSRGLAIHLAGMLTLFATGLQGPTAKRLGFVYTANSPRSGKSLLVEMAVIAVMGRCNTRTIPDNSAEFLKVLDTAARSATPYLFFDEVEGNVRNKDLNAFMTSPFWAGRKFSVQEDFSCPKVTIIFLAGNNLTLQSDLEGRTLVCDLFIEESNVRDRRIGRVLSAEEVSSPAHRGDVLSALWALVRNWDATGRWKDENGRSKVKLPKPGFEAWSEIYGGIVAAAGLGDPLALPAADASPDSQHDDMLLLVEKLSADLGKAGGPHLVPEREHEYTFEEVIACCLEWNCFAWIIDGRWKTEKLPEGREERWYEVTPRAGAIMGKLFSSRYGAQVFKLADGRRVRFGSRGKNRQRKYTVKLEG